MHYFYLLRLMFLKYLKKTLDSVIATLVVYRDDLNYTTASCAGKARIRVYKKHTKVVSKVNDYRLSAQLAASRAETFADELTVKADDALVKMDKQIEGLSQ